METDQKPFKIYKSSAGSGKTYTLVLSYLTIILQDDDLDKFKKILAITFTNKASKEMKERILIGLETLIKGEDTSFVDAYEKATGLNANQLKTKANSLFTKILHNYGQLNIQTIDKFVHKLIRSFSRELGLTTNFELETNVDEFIQRCIDELLESVGDNKQLTKTLIDYTRNLVDEDGFPNLEYALESQSKLLRSEEGGLALEVYSDMSLKDFEEIQKKLNQTKKEHRSALKVQAKSILEMMEGYDFSTIKNGRTITYAKTIDDILKDEKHISYSETQIKNAKEEKWYSQGFAKSNPEIDSHVKSISERLKKELIELFGLIKKDNLYQEVDKKLVSFSLLNSIKQLLIKVKKDNNIVFISDFNEIISEVIKNEPTPYIYEKMGNRFSHYFIDEFQDTSVLQWNNLIPLVHDSLATQNKNLIVGDAKQSIYRWRGGDASQFINLPQVNADIADINFINSSFVRNGDLQTLQDNYRSSESVIDFNNWLFERLKDEYAAYPIIQEIYKDVHQNKIRKEKGLVKVQIYQEFHSSKIDSIPEKELIANDPLEILLKDIKQCEEDNFQLGDICILVRRNKQGAEIANFLKSHDIEVTSQDSLLLSESQPVLAVVNLISALNVPNDENIIKAFYTNHKGESVIKLFDKYRIPNEKNEFYNKGFNFDQYLTDYIPDFQLSYYSELSIFDKVDYLVPLLGFSRQSIFMDKLLNFSFDFQQRFGHNVNYYLELFEAKKSKISVTPPETTNAVKIMTIHKSKGLQFPVVMIPQKLESPDKDATWIQDSSLQALGLDNFALNLKDELITEELKERKLEVEELRSLDSTNILYVALTRAEDRMYINLKKAPATPKDISYPAHLEKIISTHSSFDADTNSLTIGERSEKPKKTDTASPSKKAIQFNYSNWRSTLDLSISPKAQQEDFDHFLEFEWGKIIHEILQSVDHIDSVYETLTNFLLKNPEWNKEENNLKAIFKHFVNNKEVISLFEDQLEVLSERAIIDKNGAEIRPDKIIIKKDHICLIDFKTGTSKKSHLTQIEAYKETLSALFQKPIKMYLIYLSPDKTTVQHV